MDLLDHLARLSRLALDAPEKRHLGKELERVIALLGELAAVDTDGVEPLAHPLDIALPLREDEVIEHDRSGELLALSNEAQGGFYVVPKVID